MHFTEDDLCLDSQKNVVSDRPAICMFRFINQSKLLRVGADHIKDSSKEAKFKSILHPSQRPLWYSYEYELLDNKGTKL